MTVSLGVTGGIAATRTAYQTAPVVNIRDRCELVIWELCAVYINSECRHLPQ
jgi:hypothetical protein